MDNQQSQSYMMHPPPPPPHAPPLAVDPYQRPPPLPPTQHSHPWPYSTHQFHHQIQHSRSPPPPQWVPPQSRSSDHAQYIHPPPPPPPYPGHQPLSYAAHPHYPQSHTLPTRPPPAPRYYTQDMGNGSWSHHQSWDYSSNNNEQDWAEKARAWAAKAATDNQYPVPVGRPEEQNYLHDQYPQSINPQFQSVHVPIEQASSYQQYPVGMGPSSKTGSGQLQEPQYITQGQSSYIVDMHVPYAARDGNLIGNSCESTHPQENSSISPLPYQQEVPSSYSSVSGNEDAADTCEQFNSSSSLHVSSMPHPHAQPLPPAVGRSGWAEEHRHFLSSKPDESVAGRSDQPLNFSHHFNHNLDQHMQPHNAHPSGGPVRGLDPAVSIASNYAWTPSSASGIVHPPMPPTISLGAQVDHPVTLPSSASGHSTPIFPTGHSFQLPAPLIGASFGAGSGVVSHPTTSFPADAYGVFERPKKASVPNWLREEIIKNKTVMTSSIPMLPQEDLPSTEEDINDKFSQKVDLSDSKSIDSSSLAEDDDEDEDVEAARNAAINKEIKRVLTEVLLKVTDELFDEIATKVLNEDLSVKVGQNLDMSMHPVLPSQPTISTSTASAKVIIPAKTIKINSEDGSEKSASGSAGDVLGLGSYASDEDDENQISGKLNSKENSTNQLSSSTKVLEVAPFVRNDGSRKETEEHGNIVTNLEKTGTVDSTSAAHMGLNDYRAVTSSDTQQPYKKASCEDEMPHGYDISMSNKSSTEKAVERNDRPDGNLDARKSSDNSRIQKTGNRSDKNDIHVNKRNPVEKDREEPEYAKEMLDKKGDENHMRHEERLARNEKKDYHNGSKDKGKEKGRIGEKAQDPEARKRISPSEGKEGKSETRGDRGRSSKESNDEKRHDKTRDEKRERSRYKNGSDASRHKPRKDNLVASCSNDSSDGSPDASKRKSRHSKRHASPSPTGSRKRQLSRSPHRKHSKRRHTHYSSLENTRGRSPSRSRSRSPVRRRR